MTQIRIVPYAEMEDLQRNVIYVGHVLDVLGKLPPESFDCAIFSPPYYGVRDYSKDGKSGMVIVEPVIWDAKPGCEHAWMPITAVRKATPGDVPGPGSRQASRRTPAENRAGKDSDGCTACGAWRGDLGGEPTVFLFVKHLVDVCRLVLRVLKPWGCMAVIIGDTYAGSGGSGGRWSAGERAHQQWKQPPQPFKDGSLILVPHRLEIAVLDELQAVIFNDVIWRKPNMGFHPNYLRFGNQHEHVMVVSKSDTVLFYVNTKTLRSQREKPLGTRGVKDVDWKPIPHKTCLGKGCSKCEGGLSRETLWKPYKRYFNRMLEDLKHPNIKGGHAFGGRKAASYGNMTLTGNEYDATKLEGRNMRDVMDIAVSHYTGGHTACMPPELAKVLLDAFCPREVCTVCGLPRARVGKDRWSNCGCNAPFQRGLALEPFNGAGTTMVAGAELKVDVTGIEIKAQYAEEAKARVATTDPKKKAKSASSVVANPHPITTRSLEAFCKQG